MLTAPRTVAALFVRADSVSVDRLRALFVYDPETGIVSRRIAHFGRPAGAVVGTLNRGGYLVVSVDRKLLYLHRIALALTTGAWPLAEIDHIDGLKSNNRWANLRDVDRSTNCQNRRGADRDSGTGLLGAFVAGEKFESKIRVRGAMHRLGTFDTAEEAHAAYIAAKRELHEGCTL